MIKSRFNIIDAVCVCALFVNTNRAANIGSSALMVRVRFGVRVRVKAYFGCDVSITYAHVECH